MSTFRALVVACAVLSTSALAVASQGADQLIHERLGREIDDTRAGSAIEHLVTDEISIGDFVLTGGELPALMVMDAVARFLPGVLGDPDGAMDDSHASGLLEYPHYTRPPEFRGWGVPEVLLSGHHAQIERWRREQALERTLRRRPDMLEKAELTGEDIKFLDALKGDEDTQE